MEKQRELIHNTDWNNLIVLDACRYDIFEETYTKHMEGNLKKVTSAGSATPDWLRNTWGDGHYDLKYFSANPFVNNIDEEFNGFNSVFRFSEIVDVWKYGWNEGVGTVMPKTFKKYISEEGLVERNVFHLMQPHRPLIPIGDDYGEVRQRKAIQNHKSIKNKTSDFAKNKIVDILGETKARNLALFFFGEDAIGDYERMFRDIGSKKVIEAYKKNLEIALDAVEGMISILSGKTVITADHGESFGKKNVWGHTPDSDLDVLRTVPWLEVSKDG